MRFADIRSQRFMMHGSRQQLVQHVCQIRIHVKIVAMRGAYQSSRRVAGRSAASALPKCSQFFLPTASCFINCSTSLLSIGIMMRWHAHHSAGATGQLYQGRFKSFPTQTDGHGLTVSRDRVEVARTPPQCQARLAVWRRQLDKPQRCTTSLPNQNSPNGKTSESDLNPFLRRWQMGESTGQFRQLRSNGCSGCSFGSDGNCNSCGFTSTTSPCSETIRGTSRRRARLISPAIAVH